MADYDNMNGVIANQINDVYVPPELQGGDYSGYVRSATAAHDRSVSDRVIAGLYDQYVAQTGNSGKTLAQVRAEQTVNTSPVAPASGTPEVDPNYKWWRDMPNNGNGTLPKFDYIDASLAERYGMDAATAYQEALANTAHQREVKDLIAAGLNPILSGKYGGASGVSSAAAMGSASGGSHGSGGVDAEEEFSIGSIIGDVVALATGSKTKGNAAKGLADSFGSRAVETGKRAWQAASEFFRKK